MNEFMNSDTPRTDAAAFDKGCDGRDRHANGEYVESDFARKLERENAMLRETCRTSFSGEDMRAAMQGMDDFTDTERLNWLEKNDRSVNFVLMDDPGGEPTRHLWIVEGYDASKYRYGIREAIDAAMDEANPAPR